MGCYNSELPIGPPGPTGPQGPTGIISQGNYSPTTFLISGVSTIDISWSAYVDYGSFVTVWLNGQLTTDDSDDPRSFNFTTPVPPLFDAGYECSGYLTVAESSGLNYSNVQFVIAAINQLQLGFNSDPDFNLEFQIGVTYQKA
jgi:hypothetical protein